jgi:hypothetical protein
MSAVILASAIDYFKMIAWLSLALSMVESAYVYGFEDFPSRILLSLAISSYPRSTPAISMAPCFPYFSFLF